jgi:hypothetical protein
MGFFRFRRSIQILPGIIRFNFGKRGVSTSIGVRGAQVTFGRTGTRTAVGLPGSGLSYTPPREAAPGAPGRPRRSAAAGGSGTYCRLARAWRGWLWIELILVIALAVGWQLAKW